MAAAQEYKLKGVTSLDLSPGTKLEVEVEGVEGGKVLLVNAAGTVQATGSKCTHYGAPLVKGVLTKSGRLTCPWHGGMSFPHLHCTLSRPGVIISVLTILDNSLLQRQDW